MGTTTPTPTSAEVEMCNTIKQLQFGDFFALTNPLVLSGLLIGAMLPFLFAALTMLSVGKAATVIILEVRRQLKEMPLLKELANRSASEDWATGFEKMTEEEKACKPDTDGCVAICTQSSIKEMLLPGIIAVMTPIGVGLLVGARCLGGLLMGAIATGFLMAVMMNNAGGAWDNSKKWVENDGQPDAEGNPRVEFKEVIGYAVPKSTDHHSAVVTGDTVGDPFKDTSGLALNILIKLMSVLSLTCAGIFKNDWETPWSGIAVLVVEFLIIGITFYYVWQIDDTMDFHKKESRATETGTETGTETQMNVLQGANDKAAPSASQEAQQMDVATPQVQADQAVSNQAQPAGGQDSRGWLPPGVGCDTGADTNTAAASNTEQTAATTTVTTTTAEQEAPAEHAAQS